MRSRGEQLRVLFATPECAPYCQSGGLGEFSRDLPPALAKQGVEVVRIMPWYPEVRRSSRGITEDAALSFEVRFEGKKEAVTVGRSRLEDGVPTLLLGNQRWIQRRYGGPEDRYGMREEHLPFWFFSVAVDALLKRWDWKPHLVHCNDQHTGLLPVRLQHRRGPRPRTLLTIHNAYYQGSFRLGTRPPRFVDSGRGPLPSVRSSRARWVNMLRRGVLAADAVSTVSPTYARDLRAEREEFQLADALPQRVEGIVNGVDLTRFDPATDRNLARRFDQRTLDRRVENKLALQRLAGLPQGRQHPVLGMVCRASSEKGFLLLFQTLDELLALGAQIVVSAAGHKDLVAALRSYARRFPGFVHLPFEPKRESLILAGSDVFLMPSLLEPCGIAQLRAMRYGCVPVVHARGGLKDTVTDFATPGKGTGFWFEPWDYWAFFTAVSRALAVLARPREWADLQRRCMRVGFSWEQTAREYVGLYRRILSPKDRAQR